MSIKRLLAHIRVLGLWRGLKYWRIELACRREPQKVVEWADRCEKEGNDCYLRGDHHEAFCMWGWANELRMAHRAFTGNYGILQAKGVVVKQG